MIIWTKPNPKFKLCKYHCSFWEKQYEKQGFNNVVLKHSVPPGTIIFFFFSSGKEGGKLLTQWPEQDKFLQGELRVISPQGHIVSGPGAEGRRAVTLQTSESVECKQVGPWVCPGCLIPGRVSASPPGWGESSCPSHQGRCGESGACCGGGPLPQEVPVDCVGLPLVLAAI